MDRLSQASLGTSRRNNFTELTKGADSKQAVIQLLKEISLRPSGTCNIDRSALGEFALFYHRNLLVPTGMT